MTQVVKIFSDMLTEGQLENYNFCNISNNFWIDA